MALKAIATGRKDILMIPPGLLIRRKGWNDRDPDENDALVSEHVRILAEDIKQNGVLVPLEIELIDDKPYIVDGFTRHRAVELAILEGAEVAAIPCIPKPRGMTEIDTHFHKWSANIHEGLGPLAQGRFFSRMLRMGLTMADLARRTGKSKTHVDNCLQLLEAPAEIVSAVSRGEVSASAALQAIRKEGPAGAAESIGRAVSVAKRSGKKKATPKSIKAASTGNDKRASRSELEALLAECRDYLSDWADERAEKLVRKIKRMI